MRPRAHRSWSYGGSSTGTWSRVVDPPDVAALLAAAGVAVTTMGRGPEADPLFFRAAAAAGHLAGTLAAAST